MVPGSEIPVKKMGSEYTSPNQDQRGSTHYSNTIAKNMPDSESLAFIDHNNLILYRLIHKYLIPPHPIRRENMSKKSDMKNRLAMQPLAKVQKTRERNSVRNDKTTLLLSLRGTQCRNNLI
jgi:hypothetical protein